MQSVNRQFILAARPTGFPKESDFNLVESPVPSPQAGEFLVRAHYLSVDPYMRGRMNDVKSYAKPVQIGEVMTGGVVGEVVESKHDKFKAGDIVTGQFGWQEFATSDGAGVRKVDPSLAPISTAVGVLGMPGLTAYFGLLDVCDPHPGETVLVSGAAGAVGALVGQIAKIKGCRAVGIAGTDDKIKYLTDELGFDAAFNYKTDTNYFAKMRELCPNGIDSYFDNVGGEITDAALRLLNVHARVSICGQISQYNVEKPELGPRLLGLLIVTRSKVQGFLVSDYAARFGEGLQQMAGWIKEGKLKYHENIIEGFENMPRAFIGMLRGENTGKQLVKAVT
ncbi:MAG: NADP-dependent oxidoreductase [Acidobacteriota bacterium]|nr:NADP-dependent oxidoreductase [Acidobacteriota bacterium]